jgi:ParG
MVVMSNAKLGMKAGRPSSTKSVPTLSDLADKSDTVRVNFDLDRADHMKLKIYAAKSGRSITDILRELVSSIDEKSI